MTATALEDVRGTLPADVGRPAPVWQRFETAMLEIALPKSFFGGDPRRDMNSILERARELGAMFPGLAKTMKQAAKQRGTVQYFFVALDSSVPGAEVSILREKLSFVDRRTPLEEYMAVACKTCGDGLVEQSVVSLGPCTAGRIVHELAEKKRFGRPRQVTGRALQFVVKGSKEFWILTYRAPIAEWARLLPVFERSASTLRLKEVAAA